MEGARPQRERDAERPRRGQGAAGQEPAASERANAQSAMAHLQRSAGNAAVAKALADGRRVPLQVQRAVGFEFEAGLWTLERVNGALPANQKDGSQAVPDAHFTPMTKGENLRQGSNFKLTPDEGEDHEVPGAATHIEFVTEPFQETDEGRKQLKTAMKEMKELGDRLLASRSRARVRRQGREVPRVEGNEADAAIANTVLVTPRGSMAAEPQMTAGVRLEELAGMLEKLSTAAMAGETQQQTQKRHQGAGYLSGKKMTDATLLANAPGIVRTRFTTFPARTLHSPDTMSNAMVSLLALIRSYIQNGTKRQAYAKTLAPLLAKTDFATMFADLPEATYYRSYPDEWAALGLHVSDVVDGPVFSGGIDYVAAPDVVKIQAALSRAQWLRGIANGTDYLTEASFPDQSVAGNLFGFGARGKKTDVVGKKRRGKKSTLKSGAPILEFRRMAGSVPHHAWPALALELFDHVRAVNDLQNPTFSASETVKERNRKT